MTSTYRYINTLVELGYLEKDAKTKEIRPSILCLLFCANLMRATDHLKMIKERRGPDPQRKKHQHRRGLCRG
jgi:DNA-binding IclR family transcriptional regulator